MKDNRTWVRQRDPSDNLPAALTNLLAHMKVEVTPSSVRETLLTHPHFPSLLSAVDALEGWNVESQGLQCGPDDLEAMPLPGIAHLHKNGGHFVMLHSVEDGNVTYLDPEIGWKTTSLGDLEREWSGMLLVGAPSPEAGEKGYATKVRERLIATRLRWLSLAAAVIMLAVLIGVAVPRLLLEPRSILVSLVNLLGLGLCVPLVLHYFANNAGLITRLCPTGSKMSCAEVLSSPAGTLFGIVPLGDIGALYFLGSLFSLLSAALSNEVSSALWWLSALACLTLPFTLFSLYYQGVQLKKWCWLCVGVQAVLWLAFFILLPKLWSGVAPSAIGALPHLLLGFGFPALLWATIRPALSAAAQASTWKYQYLRLRSHPTVIKVLLDDETPVEMGSFPVEFVRGNTCAAHRLTLVVNPECRHCANEYLELEWLLRQFPDELCATVRFLHYDHESSVGEQLVREVLTLTLANRVDLAAKSLHEWFAQIAEGKSSKAMLSRRSTPMPTLAEMEKKADDLMRAYREWADRVHINVTPVAFYNELALPEEIHLKALKTLFLSTLDAGHAVSAQGN